MTRYELWSLLHVLAAVVWAGGAFAMTVAVIAAQLHAVPLELPLLARVNSWVGARILTPAGVVAFVAGVLLVADGPWDWGQTWIALGLAGFALTFLPGFVFLTPEARRLVAAMREHGPGHPEVGRRVRRILFVSRLVTVLLVLVVADMTLKPTGEDEGILAAGAVVLAGAVVGIVLLGRRGVTPGGPPPGASAGPPAAPPGP